MKMGLWNDSPIVARVSIETTDGQHFVVLVFEKGGMYDFYHLYEKPQLRAKKVLWRYRNGTSIYGPNNTIRGLNEAVKNATVGMKVSKIRKHFPLGVQAFQDSLTKISTPPVRPTEAPAGASFRYLNKKLKSQFR